MNTKLSKKLTRASIPVLAFLASMENAYCQSSVDLSQAITSTNSTLTTVGNSIIFTVELIMGITAIVFVAINLVKFFKSPNHETNNDLLKIGIGLIIGIIMIEVVKTLFKFTG